MWLSAAFRAAAISLPIVYYLARRRGAPWTARAFLVFAALLLWLVALLNLVSAGGMVLTLQRVAASNENLLLFGLPALAVGWFLLPWVVAILVVGVEALLAAAWLKSWWRLAGRVDFTLLTLTALGFSGLLQ